MLTLTQLLLSCRPGGTTLFTVGYHEAKFQAGSYFKFSAYQQKGWLRQWQDGIHPMARTAP